MKHPLASALARPPSAIAVVPRILCPSPLDDDALIELSERFRVAGAAALVMRGTALNSVHVVLEEQRRAAGNYPGPLPVVYEPSTPMDDTTLDALHSSGVAGILLPADAMVLPPSAPPLLVVPRCETSAELDAVLAAPTPAPLVFAAAELVDSDSGALGAVDNGASASPVLMTSLSLGEDMASSARVLRAGGCSAVAVDFDTDEWPAAPETIVGAILSKKSPVIGSLGVQYNAYGSYTSDQYWMNKKFKQARENGKQREKQFGSRHTDAADGAGVGDSASSGGKREAGSGIPKIS